jgi:VanZ family protein
MTEPGTTGWPTRLLAAATGAYACVLVFATHYPRPEELLGRHHPSDKTLHFLAYGVLAGLAAATLATTTRWLPRGIARLAAGLAVFGALDEVTQPLFSRAADPLDWVYDCIGIGAGLAIVMACTAAVTAALRGAAPRQ